jgi:hypothetical protein
LGIKNTILKTYRSKKRSQEELKYFALDENGNITYLNLQDAANVVLTGKFIALNT